MQKAKLTCLKDVGEETTASKSPEKYPSVTARATSRLSHLTQFLICLEGMRHKCLLNQVMSFVDFTKIQILQKKIDIQNQNLKTIVLIYKWCSSKFQLKKIFFCHVVGVEGRKGKRLALANSPNQLIVALGELDITSRTRTREPSNRSKSCFNFSWRQ